jgi:hypothetical protein
MIEISEVKKMNNNIVVDQSVDIKYKGKNLFPEKLKRALKHIEGRDINAEIKNAIEKEKSTTA